MASAAPDRPIYLDYHATTPCDARVIDAMRPFFAEEFGNAASRTHGYGWRAAEAVESARARVAGLIGSDAREVVFTSGATESNNLALLGALRARLREGARDAHVVTWRTEHNAVLDPLRALEREGVRVTRLPVARDGLVDLDALAGALEPATALVSLMHANNEIGVIQDLAAVSRVTRERGVLLHTDAAQSVGKLPVDVDRLGVDLLSLTAHKLCGPKGVGALYVRRRGRRVALEPLQHGGGHERGLRSGTLPVPLCVGLGEACSIAGREMEAEAARVGALRDRLWQRLRDALDGTWLNGHPERRLPGNLNASFDGVEGEALLMAVAPHVAVSAGSACTSARPEPSHVLRALGLAPARTLSALRFGLGRFTTADEVETAAERVVAEVRRLRELSPLWKEGERASV